jgi:CcmD family protein
MDSQNLRFLFFGYSAVWIIVFAFVVMLVKRGKRIDHELERLRSLVDEKEK